MPKRKPAQPIQYEPLPNHQEAAKEAKRHLHKAATGGVPEDAPLGHEAQHPPLKDKNLAAEKETSDLRSCREEVPPPAADEYVSPDAPLAETPPATEKALRRRRRGKAESPRGQTPEPTPAPSEKTPARRQ